MSDNLSLLDNNLGNWNVDNESAQLAADYIRDNMDYVLKLDDYAYDLSQIHQVAENIRSNFKRVVLLGTGGSSLTGQALCALVTEKNKWAGYSPEIIFLDNIDPDTVSTVIDNIDIKQTCVLAISKSGGTMETISQLALFIEEIKQQCGESSVKHQIIAISDPSDNPLRRIAERFGFLVMDHEAEIGGRYSIFTNVALLPAAICGMDIVGIVEGGKKYLEENLHEAALASSAHAKMMQQGIHSTVVMPYIDRLKPMVNWWRQIWAESLGRRGVGITPISASGTTDQHSQLQLYLDGYKDKSYTIITLEQKGLGKEIPYINIADKKTEYMKNKNFGDLIYAAGAATHESILYNNLPVRKISLTHIDEETMGRFAMQFILETILTAKILNLNPYGQPAVEDGKIRAIQKLTSY